MTVPPVVGELNEAAEVPPLQTTWLLTFTVAVGLTVMSKLVGVPVHVTPAFV